MPLVFVNRWLGLAIGLTALVTGCSGGRSRLPLRQLTFYQTWQLQSGSTVAGYRVNSGLGDIGLDLQGRSVYAPYTGQVQPHPGDCVLFSTASLPAYLFRLCGLHRPRLGPVNSGDPIGAATYLQIAALRKQPNGTWAFVEPSASLLTGMLQQP